MLSTSAFNALLKILEEPPPHIVFIMATTELHKIPETIRSRAQEYEFRTISATAIAGQLRAIATADHIDVGIDYESLAEAGSMLGSGSIIERRSAASPMAGAVFRASGSPMKRADESPGSAARTRRRSPFKSRQAWRLRCSTPCLTS